MKRWEKALYKGALITFGEYLQLTVATEELAELQQQICKVQRGELDKKHLAEELADALIGIEQVVLITGVTYEEIRRAKNRKQQRLIQRIAQAQGLGIDKVTDWLKELEKTV